MRLATIICLLVLIGTLGLDHGRAQPLSGCGPPRPLPADIPSPGEVAAARVEACRAALKMQPNDREMLFRLAKALIATEQYRDAIRYLLDAADRGHAGAMTEMGLLFEHGHGVPANTATARTWLERAANRGGSPRAMFELGRWHETGKDGERDLAEARRWYEQAAARGDADAMNQLGVFYLKGTGVPANVAVARDWFAKAAERGSAKAMTHLGRLDDLGQGTAANSVTARAWFEKAIAAGDPDATAELGGLYEKGRGVGLDIEAARDLYDKGAARGSALAMTYLASLYARGIGTPLDFVQTRLWYDRAATLGLPQAMTALGELYLSGAGGPRNATTARELFEKAAEQDDAAAMRNLGLVYLRGQGVERDETSAKQWFEKAAALGDEPARINLSRFEEAARAGFSTLAAQLIARRTTCTQSCRTTHRTFISSVCDRFFAGAPIEEGDRRSCIDLSLRLSQQCAGSCRDLALASDGPNPCDACYQDLLGCVAGVPSPDAGGSTRIGYPEIARRCAAQIERCTAVCRTR